MVVYVKYNQGRKAQYRIVTSIIKENGLLYSRKEAELPEGEVFLESLISNYELLGRAGLSFALAKPSKKEKSIYFEFADGQSLDSLLFKEIQNSDKDSVRKIFQLYKELMDKIPLKEDYLDDKFMNYFGEVVRKKYECMQIGCIDLIMDNIFINNGKYQLIDYEWVFNFTLPMKFVYFRTILNSYNKYDDYNIGKILPINETLRLFEINDSDAKNFLKYEYNFQTKNSKKECMINYEEYLEKYKKIGLSSFGDKYDLITEELDKVKRDNEKKEGEINKLSFEVSARNNEITFMKNTKIWRLRMAIVKMKKTFFGAD